MATDAQALSALRLALTDVLGEEHTHTLMETLPRGTPAARVDLDEVEGRLGARMDGLEHRMGALEDRMGGLESRMGGLEHRMDIFEVWLGAFRETSIAQTDGLRHEVLGAISRESGSLRTEVAGQTRTLVFSMIATFMTFAALVLVTVRFP
ncbi:MAG: hypothetical protein H0V93_02615 [Euzebyales bacterium]|jgi:hypothetical protein|nr:hypothetical protein [Euzebyales bacterium]